MRRIAALTLVSALLMSVCIFPAGAVTADDRQAASGPVVEQDLDYTEDPVDIPNPDRGFYRANDGMVVPVTATEESDSQQMNVGEDPVDVAGVQVETRVSHVYFDLRNFSGNAITDRPRELRYTEDYQAPEDVSVRSRGDAEPCGYDTHFEYWLENVVPTWPHGKSQELTEDALNYIRDKLQQVRDGQGVTMVRFNYDGPGFSWVSVEHPEDGEIDQLVWDVEPEKEILLRHIEQIGEILHEYEDVIMGVDGGMFGPWGEMHSTQFGTSPEAYQWLVDAWLEAVPESRSIVVQPGAFLAWYNATYGTDYTFATIDQIPAPEPGTPEARIGFFNDSYAFGTDDPEWIADDWGSLAEGLFWPDEPYGTEEDYDRGKLLTRIRKQNSLYGGEAQGPETLWNTYPFVAFEASYAQTVYLNADYEDEVHQRWADFIYNEENMTKTLENAYDEPYTIEQAIFDPVYDGRNGLEYWRDRLGYRLVLREAGASKWVTRDGTLTFEGKLQNVGFGNIVNRKNVTVLLVSRADGAVYSVLSDLDARDWKPDLDSRAANTAAYRDISFSIPVSKFGSGIPEGKYDIYLKINDPKEMSENKRCIRFANNGDIWNADLGANLIGTTEVMSAAPPSWTDCDRGETCPLSAYVDADPAGWYHDELHYAVENGILVSADETHLEPAGKASYAMLVTMLWRAADSPEASDQPADADVEPGQWYTEAIRWAAANGIAGGTDGEAFDPADPVTREQAVCILRRYAELNGDDTAVRDPAVLDRYGDSAAVSSFAEYAVAWAVENDILHGTAASTLSPDQNSTCAEAAALLVRYLLK